mmetsp:Transcript_2009/g.4456  ORF Transcript_2009/g.4456 Transcript_2009/m.4456 type:complete len:200 (-) Transcript_2009:57-656(-)
MSSKQPLSTDDGTTPLSSLNNSVMFMGRKASLSMSKMIFLASALATTSLPPPMDVAVSCHFLRVGSRAAALALAALAAAFLEMLPLPEEAAAAEAPRGGTGEGVTPLVAVVLADEDLPLLLLLPPFLDLAVVTNPLPGGGVTAPPPPAAAAAAAPEAPRWCFDMVCALCLLCRCDSLVNAMPRYVRVRPVTNKLIPCAL